MNRDHVTDTALLVIDMQRAYFNNNALEKRRGKLVEACNQLLDFAYRNNLPVFNVRTAHKNNVSTWTLNMLKDQTGYLFEDDDDTKNIEGLHLQNAINIVKTRDSAFYNTNLEAMLRTLRVQHLIICGVSTHTCVMLTAADAYALNFEATIARSAVATHDVQFHDTALSLLAQEYRQDVLDNQAIFEQFATTNQ